MYRLNELAARAFGGDSCFKTPSQPARLCGSINLKSYPAWTFIIEDNAQEEHELADLAERIEALDTAKTGEGNLSAFCLSFPPAKPPVGETILNTVREGGVDEVNRFQALSRHAGFFLRRCHEGTITRDQTWQEIVDYNEFKISPPWPEERLQREVQALWDKHVKEHGPAKPVAQPDPVIPVEADTANDDGSDTFPAELLQTDGALQALASHINRNALYPQPELALAASLSALGALMGRRVCGRTDLRTNIYTIGVAGSASGKNHARQIIKKAFGELGTEVKDMLGEEIASGQAVLTALGKNPSKLFVIDEFGLFLKAATNPHAPDHLAKTNRMFMQLFSDANTTHSGTDYANQKERPREPIEQPNLCIHGTTTPETFWAAMGSGNVSDGSLARYLIFYSNTPDVRRNKAARKEPIPQDLKQALYSVLADIPAGEDGEPYPVAYSEGALDVLDAFIDECDDRKIAMAGDSRQSIIGRMAEHAEKMAIIRAVSRNPKAPEISGTEMEWACALSRHCCGFMVRNIAAHVADNATERASNELLAFIKARGADGVTKTEITRKFRKIPTKDRDGHIHTLIEAQLIDQTTHETGGKPTTVYVAR